MAGLWGDLSPALARLEAVAANPHDELEDEEVLDSLAVLQYSLHTAGELALGIEPPAEAGWAHQELSAALADARDATAEILDAVEAGGAEGGAILVHEWRGALFRVRHARHRLVARPGRAPAPAPPVEPRASRTAVAATLLVVLGVGAFTAGAVFALWQLWAAGLTLVATGFFAYRP
jgi:hypothetical protein